MWKLAVMVPWHHFTQLPLRIISVNLGQLLDAGQHHVLGVYTVGKERAGINVNPQESRLPGSAALETLVQESDLCFLKLWAGPTGQACTPGASAH